MKRRRWLLTLPLTALLGTLWPRPAFAACGVTDPGGCVDGALYSFWYGLAGFGWSIDRTLLLLAYQLSTFRWWLVEVAFTSAYQVLVQIISPLILPVAIIAILLGCLFFLLLPVVGRTSLVNIRHALIWVVLAPLLITLSGPFIVQLEQLRSTVGTALFSGVSVVAPGAIFGASGGDMRGPQRLYPANPCGTGTLTRRDSGGLQLDDLAAAMLWADAEDIQCPDRGGPSADVPDLFYEAAPTGPGYARDSDISLLDAGNDRTVAVTNMQRGAIRTFLGLLPSMLAVLDALVQLVFALCLIALWIGLPIGLVFVFFEATATGVSSIFRRMLTVLQVSWSSSALLGIVAACLIAAANLRNASAYTGFAIGGIVLTGYMLTVAVDTLKGCIRTLNDTVAAGTGLSVTQPFEMAGTALGVGAAVATGGAAAGLTAAAAMKQTGSGRYAAASVLGRIRPIAELGEVASAMGWMDDEEVREGLHAGSISTRSSWRGTRMQMLSHGIKTDPQGRTFRVRAEERQLQRELHRHETPTAISGISDLVAAGGRAVDYVGSANIADDIGALASWLPEKSRAGWSRVRRGWFDFRDDVNEQADGSTNPVRRGLAAIQVLDDRLRPGERGKALRLDEQRELTYESVPEELPVTAQTVAKRDARIPRLLTLGYTVAEQDDATIAYWKAPESTAAPKRGAIDPRVAAAEERLKLVQAGALAGKVADAQAAVGAARELANQPLAAPTPTPLEQAPAPEPTPELPPPVTPQPELVRLRQPRNPVRRIEVELERLGHEQLELLAVRNQPEAPPDIDYRLLTNQFRRRELEGERSALLATDPVIAELTPQLIAQEERQQRLTREAVIAETQHPNTPRERVAHQRRAVSLELRRQSLTEQITANRVRLDAAIAQARLEPAFDAAEEQYPIQEEQ